MISTMSSLSRGVGYTTRLTSAVVHHATNKILNDRVATKKALQIVKHAFELKQVIQTGAVQAHEFTKALGHIFVFFKFCEAWRLIEFWITRPFSKEVVDWKALKSRLKDSNPDTEEMEGAVERVMTLARAHPTYLTKESVIAQLKELSEGTHLSIPDDLIIPIQRRSIPQYLSMCCMTISNWGGCALKLHTWGVLSFSWVSKAVAAIGGTQILSFVARVGLQTMFSAAATVGMAINLVDTTWKLIQSFTDLSSEGNELKKKRGELFLKLMSTLCELAASAAPLLFTLNPLVGISLGLLANAIGLVKVFAYS